MPTIPETLAKYADIIHDIQDGRKTGTGIWVYLVAGYWCPYTESSVIHEDTLVACAYRLSVVRRVRLL